MKFAEKHSVPTEAEIRSIIETRRNWGRWGADDERGALNLITPETRLRAIGAVRTGQALSLSRPLATWAAAGNSQPIQHYMKVKGGSDKSASDHAKGSSGGWATDYIGMAYHGVTTTHIDALCHVWDADGLYNGRRPEDAITYDGATFGGIDNWVDGIFTRGVLLDVPRWRGTEFVTDEAPVMGWELEEILRVQQLKVLPGDAVLVYSGREKWQASNPDKPYGRYPVTYLPGPGSIDFQKPGLHASCLKFLRDHDFSTLVWDMLDATPYGYDIAHSIHGAIHAFGIALVDNALLEPVAEVCNAQDRHDFLLTVSPLEIQGGTGSPVNPVAIL